MKRKLMLIMLVCMVITGLAFAGGGMEGGGKEGSEAMLAKSKAIDISHYTCTDGNPLLETAPLRTPPSRPADPSALPIEDSGSWWDIEYAGYTTKKEKMPPRPEGGAIGKFVVLLQAGHHPYWTGYLRGFKRVAEAYDIKYKIYNGNWTLDLQAQQAEQAINDRPDMIVFAPCDAAGALPILRKIYQAGIPVVASNTIPSEEAMKYCLTWVGPDDWGQMRNLARAFADKLGKKGGYAVVEGIPGTSCCQPRSEGIWLELLDYAPKMIRLDKDVSNYQSEPTYQMVSTWLSKYGDKLKGIMLPDDGETMAGCLEALKSANRDDVVIIAAGNSQTGLDAIKRGDAFAVTYQPAESDGALGIKLAIDWINGEDLPNVVPIAMRVITKDTVENYYPTQW